MNKANKTEAVKTVLLNNGREVLAKMYGGQLFAATYSNRKQACNKAAELGAPWAVFHWGRPFYVAQDKPDVRYRDEMKPEQNTEAAPVSGHTTGTWVESPSGGISADGEVIIIGTTHPNPFNDGFGHAASNRAFICRAVNSHAALVEALEECVGYIEMKLAHSGVMDVEHILSELNNRVRLVSYVETAHHLGCSKTTRRVDLIKARAAIALAKEREAFRKAHPVLSGAVKVVDYQEPAFRYIPGGVS